MKIRMFVSLVIALLGITWVGSAHAIPAFARKYEKACNSCHTAWPQLNKAGRIFKENGYRFPTDKEDKTQQIADISWEKGIPLSALLVARPYDKKGSGDAKTRALHEIELISAGRYTDKVSGYFELEMEDEPIDVPVTGTGLPPDAVATLPGFNWVLMPHGSVTYHVSPMANVAFTWGPASWTDPYDTYSQSRRLFRGGSSAIPGALQSSRQHVSVYGRASDLFYSVGIAGQTGDTEGSLATTTTIARAAFDIFGDTTIGVLYVGDATAITSADVQSDIGDLRLNVAYITGGPTNDYTVQATYVAKTSTGKPTWVPAVRFEDVNGTNRTSANIGYYFRSNAKGFLEYYTDPADNRITLQAAVAF